MRWKDLNHGYADRIAVMAAKQPHELLGVAADSPPDQIKAAYLKLVKTYHPDKSDPFMARHNEEVLKLINAAYERIMRDYSR